MPYTFVGINKFLSIQYSAILDKALHSYYNSIFQNMKYSHIIGTIRKPCSTLYQIFMCIIVDQPCGKY